MEKGAKSTDSDQTPSKCIMHHNSLSFLALLGQRTICRSFYFWLFLLLMLQEEGARLCVCVCSYFWAARARCDTWLDSIRSQQVITRCARTGTHLPPHAGAPVECLIFAAVLVGPFFRNESLSGTWAFADSNSASLIGPRMSVWKWCPTPERTRGPSPPIFSPPSCLLQQLPGNTCRQVGKTSRANEELQCRQGLAAHTIRDKPDGCAWSIQSFARWKWLLPAL